MAYLWRAQRLAIKEPVWNGSLGWTSLLYDSL